MKSPETAVKTPARELTFSELVEKYLALHPLAESTRRTFVYNLNLNVLPLFGNTLVSALSLANLAALDSRLAQPSPKTGRPVSVSTRNRYKALCRAIGQWGYDQGLTAANPFDRVKLDRKKEGRAPDLITDVEISAIFKHAPPHLQWAITCMLNLGVRPGESELFAIKMSDVDIQEGGVWVKRKKTNSPMTLLPVTEDFLAKLSALKVAEPEREFLIEYENQPVGSLKTAWRATKRRAGITRRLRLYELRHWYASRLLLGGADLKATSELMGHASPALTLSTYQHLLDKQKRQAITKLTLPDLPTNKASGSNVDQNVDRRR